MHTAYIALGSNLGDRKANLEEAVSCVAAAGIKVVKVSSWLETEPYGVTDQPMFMNGVIQVETEKTPLELLKTLLAIELDMGRVRKRHWGERNIDLDLLLYEDVMMTSKELNLPHPDMQNRDFVLMPLAEITPDLVHPVLKKTAQELLDELTAKSKA